MKIKQKLSISALVVVVVIILGLSVAFALRDRAGALTEGTEEGAEEARWSGMDEVVVEKYATNSGREPSGPILPVEEGDLLLFLFCLAGTIGGFISGYFWRKLISESRSISTRGRLEES